MHWLLITTLGKNVGDEFARIGVQNLIRAIDPEARFELLCKETPDIHHPRHFDRAVLCGMPLFWSIEGNECQEIDWWSSVIRGWISEHKRKFLVLGAGHVFVNEIFNFNRYCAAIKEVLDRAWAVTTREPVMDHPNIIESVCPAVFSVTRGTRELNLCNLMPHGGHHYCLRTQGVEIEAWKRVLPAVVKDLQTRGFDFVAHNIDEVEFALSLGWQRPYIFRTPEEYLALYSRASQYFGNRLHGAVVAANAGAWTMAVAADSRVRMVERAGGTARFPSELNPLAPVVTYPPTHHARARESEKILRLVHRFAYEA